MWFKEKKEELSLKDKVNIHVNVKSPLNIEKDYREDLDELNINISDREIEFSGRMPEKPGCYIFRNEWDDEMPVLVDRIEVSTGSEVGYHFVMGTSLSITFLEGFGNKDDDEDVIKRNGNITKATGGNKLRRLRQGERMSKLPIWQK